MVLARGVEFEDGPRRGLVEVLAVCGRWRKLAVQYPSY
jgi:hypothetical protein